MSRTEAQLDRFLLKLNVGYPEADDLHEILNRTTREHSPTVSTVPLDNLDSLRELVRAVPVVREIEARAVQLVLATHPDRPDSIPLAKKFVRYGEARTETRRLSSAGRSAPCSTVAIMWRRTTSTLGRSRRSAIAS